MSYWINYLSGNVPGGIVLYIVLLIATFLVLLFMHRVNELFSLKLFVRWTAISFFTLTILYLLIWFQNPPAQILKRYSIFVESTNEENQWFAQYLTESLEHITKTLCFGTRISFPK